MPHLTGGVIALVVQVALIANELQSRIAELHADTQGPMTWTPIAITADEVVYEFQLHYTEQADDVDRRQATLEDRGAARDARSSWPDPAGR